MEIDNVMHMIDVPTNPAHNKNLALECYVDTQTTGCPIDSPPPSSPPHQYGVD